jgi:hypothetical protein
MARRVYKIESCHKNYAPVNGVFEVEVVDAISDQPAVYVSGSPFGCSRDYAGVSDESAISRLLSEHGARLGSCVRVS